MWKHLLSPDQTTFEESFRDRLLRSSEELVSVGVRGAAQLLSEEQVDRSQALLVVSAC